MAIRFIVTHPQGSMPISLEEALAFAPHSPRFFYGFVGSAFGFSEDERRNFGNWAKSNAMPARYDTTVCGEQLVRRGELLGLLYSGWSPPPEGVPGLPRTPIFRCWLPRTFSAASLSIPDHSLLEQRGLKRVALDDGSMLSRFQRRLNPKTSLGSVLLAPAQSSLGDRTVHRVKSKAAGLLRTSCDFSVMSQGAVCEHAKQLCGQRYRTCGRYCFLMSESFDVVYAVRE